jgi:hypothetical protein
MEDLRASEMERASRDSVQDTLNGVMISPYRGIVKHLHHFLSTA